MTEPKKSGRRWRQFNVLVDGTSHLSLLQRAVLVYLFRWATIDGVVDASVRQIAERIGASPRGVGKAIADLVDRCYLDVLRRGAAGRISSLYRIQYQRIHRDYMESKPPEDCST